MKISLIIDVNAFNSQSVINGKYLKKSNNGVLTKQVRSRRYSDGSVVMIKLHICRSWGENKCDFHF